MNLVEILVKALGDRVLSDNCVQLVFSNSTFFVYETSSSQGVRITTGRDKVGNSDVWLSSRQKVVISKVIVRRTLTRPPIILVIKLSS